MKPLDEIMNLFDKLPDTIKMIIIISAIALFWDFILWSWHWSSLSYLKGYLLNKILMPLVSDHLSRVAYDRVFEISHLCQHHSNLVESIVSNSLDYF